MLWRIHVSVVSWICAMATSARRTSAFSHARILLWKWHTQWCGTVSCEQHRRIHRYCLEGSLLENKEIGLPAVIYFLFWRKLAYDVCLHIFQTLQKYTRTARFSDALAIRLACFLSDLLYDCFEFRTTKALSISSACYIHCFLTALNVYLSSFFLLLEVVLACAHVGRSC